MIQNSNTSHISPRSRFNYGATIGFVDPNVRAEQRSEEAFRASDAKRIVHEDFGLAPGQLDEPEIYRNVLAGLKEIDLLEDHAQGTATQTQEPPHAELRIHGELIDEV